MLLLSLSMQTELSVEPLLRKSSWAAAPTTRTGIAPSRPTGKQRPTLPYSYLPSSFSLLLSHFIHCCSIMCTHNPSFLSIFIHIHGEFMKFPKVYYFFGKFELRDEGTSKTQQNSDWKWLEKVSSFGKQYIIFECPNYFWSPCSGKHLEFLE